MGYTLDDTVSRKQLTCAMPLYSRPKTLSDVTAQDHTVNVLQRTLQASNVSSLESPSS